MSDRKDNTKKGVALAGGALLAWLLLRGGRGLGLGGPGDRGSGRDEAQGASRVVKLRVDADGIKCDGVAVTHDEAVALARAAGSAELFATGAAREGTVADLIDALRAAGVDLALGSGLASLRNGGFVYRPVGERGEDYPEWLRNLRGSSGVYVIRDARTSEVLYVGESHSGRVYETLTRHFQEVRHEAQEVPMT